LALFMLSFFFHTCYFVLAREQAARCSPTYYKPKDNMFPLDCFNIA